VIEMPRQASGSAGGQGVSFGFALGRLSTAVVLGVREAQLFAQDDKVDVLSGAVLTNGFDEVGSEIAAG
jgi:hypothetical protein